MTPWEVVQLLQKRDPWDIERDENTAQQIIDLIGRIQADTSGLLLTDHESQLLAGLAGDSSLYPEEYTDLNILSESARVARLKVAIGMVADYGDQTERYQRLVDTALDDFDKICKKHQLLGMTLLDSGIENFSVRLATQEALLVQNYFPEIKQRSARQLFFSGLFRRRSLDQHFREIEYQ